MAGFEFLPPARLCFELRRGCLITFRKQQAYRKNSFTSATKRRSVSKAVADSSALLTLLQAESGWEMVESYLPHLVLSTVNFSEVVAKLAERGMPQNKVIEVLSGLSLQIIPFDGEQALRSGMLRPITRSIGLSLGDRVCIALGLMLDLPILTADKAWTLLPIGKVQLVR